MSDLTWIAQYSETDKPDKHGRWSRRCFYKDLHIGSIHLVNANKGIKLYSSVTYFPQTSNPMPHDVSTFNSSDEALKRIEKLWNEFLIKIS